ncbi:MAG: hypothetical protein HKN26_01740 [Acidimicrobiales bacterium]|nr:hypothetical protein [Acidimicrobiales bacterium]
MLSSIHPLGERTRQRNWSRTVVAYIAGSVLGGLALGAASAVVGWPLRAVLNDRAAISMLAAAALAGLWIDLAARGRALPSWHRQVNEDWLVAYRGWVYGLGFGVQLGAGVLTYITTAAVYVLIVQAALGGWGPALVLGGTFGLARGLLILTTARIQTPDQLRRFHRRLAAQAPRVRVGTVAALAAVAGSAVVGLAAL